MISSEPDTIVNAAVQNNVYNAYTFTSKFHNIQTISQNVFKEEESRHSRLGITAGHYCEGETSA